MAWTQADLTTLDNAFKSGASSCTIGDKRTDWRSVDEYLKLRALALSDIATSAGSPTSLCTFASYSRD